MLRHVKHGVMAMFAYGMCLSMMTGAGEACSVNIEVTGETTVQAGAGEIALGAKHSDCKKVSFQWRVKGVGSLDTPTEQTLFYTPPSTIDGHSKQAIISVTVTEADGNEASDSVTLTIVGGDIPPTPTPTKNPTAIPTEEPDCTAITADGEVVELLSSENDDWSRDWDKRFDLAIEAFRLAKQEHAKEALVYQLKENVVSFFRFETKHGAILYYANISRDQNIAIGQCWMKKEETGKKVSTDKYGVQHKMEKQIFYLLKK